MKFFSNLQVVKIKNISLKLNNTLDENFCRSTGIGKCNIKVKN